MPNASVSKAVSYAISRGYQITPDALKLMQSFSELEASAGKLESIISLVIEDKARLSIGGEDDKSLSAQDLITIQPDLFEGIGKEASGTNMQPVEVDTSIEIISDPSEKIQPIGIEGFQELFKSRYEKLMRILKERPEARQLVKISSINADKGVSRIGGLVYSKRQTKNGVELVVDDESGKTSILALNEETKRIVNEVSVDQCVMLEVEGKGGRLYLKSITQPDLPNRVSSTSKKTVYAVFLSDLHVGSNKFLDGAFARFLDWLSGHGPFAKEDSEIIRRLRYVIIGGDIVDGVGVFPNQEYELLENSIYKQYAMVSKKLESIPEHLKIFAIPGNHDSTRQALPQPMIPKKYAGPLYSLKNVTMLGDPSTIKLNGVSILMYHGRSLDDILATTPGLSYEQPTTAMKMLLKARHLAPIFGSRTPIAPELEDHLVIDQVPDIFHSGHVHSVGVENYRGTLIINSGTFQAQTGYQANLGIMPRPGLVPIVNLATLEVEMREFLTSS